MTPSRSTRIASFAFAVLMTLGMLGSIDGFARIESAIGAANALLAQAAVAGARA